MIKKKMKHVTVLYKPAKKSANHSSVYGYEGCGGPHTDVCNCEDDPPCDNPCCETWGTLKAQHV